MPPNDGARAHEGKSGFVIGPVDSEGTETRKHADQLLSHIITPALSECGITNVERADRIESSGTITTEIVARLNEADIVVADLSEANANVYYELAIRHLIRKPFAQLIREGEEMPFDVSGIRTIRFDLGDLDSAAAAKEQLRSTVEAELKKSAEQIETPFTIAMDSLALRRTSGGESSPEFVEVARALSRLEDTQRRILVELRERHQEVDPSRHWATRQNLAHARERERESDLLRAREFDRLRERRAELLSDASRLRNLLHENDLLPGDERAKIHGRLETMGVQIDQLSDQIDSLS